MKEIKKKIEIAYEYGNSKHKEDIIGNDVEELFRYLKNYINEGLYKIYYVGEIETIEIEKKEYVPLDREKIANWGRNKA